MAESSQSGPGPCRDRLGVASSPGPSRDPGDKVGRCVPPLMSPKGRNLTETTVMFGRVRVVRAGKRIYRDCEICRGHYDGTENNPNWGVYYQGRFYGHERTVKAATVLADKAVTGEINPKW